MGCNNISVGTGELFVARRNVGFLSGNVSYEYKYDIEKFKTAPQGGPKKTACTIVKEITANLKAGIAEISAENMAMALGGISLTTQGVTPVTVADGANHERTFISRGDSSGLQTIQLGPGPGLATTFSTVVVKNLAESTTYVADTDYTVSALTGEVTTIDGGAITDGQTVRVSYAYVPIAGNLIKLGAQFSLQQVPITFVHTKNSGKKIIVHAPLASVSGNISLGFDPDKVIVNNVEFEILDDSTNNPTMPFGYVFEET